MTDGARTWLLSAVLVLGGGATLGAATDGFQAFTTETARRVAVRRHPVELPAVPLESQSGVRFTLAERRGTWLLVDFIYTRCANVCPVLGGDFARLERLLAGPIAQGRVRLVSISFDPLHDTPARLTAYLTRFGGRSRPGAWQAARPITPEGLDRLTRAFRITVIPDGLGGYTHNAAIHLVDPEGRLADVFDLGDPARVSETVLRNLDP
jgi:protein SCO1/2